MFQVQENGKKRKLYEFQGLVVKRENFNLQFFQWNKFFTQVL